MAENSKVTQIAYWDDNSAWVERDNQAKQSKSVYRNLTQSTLNRMQSLSFKHSLYEVNISLRKISGISIFIAPARESL